MRLLDDRLERLARTKISFVRHHWPAFQFCGFTGVVLAVVLAMTLAGKTGLSYVVMDAVAVAAMATFVALVFATKVVTGDERIIYYHHEIAVMLVAAAVAQLMHAPVLSYLDVTILG